MHNEYIDWDGEVTHIESSEYDYETLRRQYLSNEYTFISGFNRALFEVEDNIGSAYLEIYKK